MDESQKQEFRALIVKITNDIDSDDFNKLKSLCKDFIGQRDLSKLNTPLDLLHQLEQHQKLKPNDVEFLNYLLEHGCKNGSTLKSHVTTYEIKWSSSKDTPKDMKRVATFLANNLGREYKRVLRSAGLPDNRIDILIEDNPRNTREVIYQGFCECFSRDASIEDIIQALEASRCKNLADKVRGNDLG
ncbi:FAS-associated death domain protein-like [Elysia marginata]|uniref:FAS-associated death domain protein-like n=1 Tax=Elysia marginata TaxID=1093978 RepID=A0AAV4J1L5_9GAST|nr:FAS-associated death domain protein-like [Elysia marginata]